MAVGGDAQFPPAEEGNAESGVVKPRLGRGDGDGIDRAGGVVGEQNLRAVFFVGEGSDETIGPGLPRGGLGGEGRGEEEGEEDAHGEEVGAGPVPSRIEQGGSRTSQPMRSVRQAPAQRARRRDLLALA